MTGLSDQVVTGMFASDSGGAPKPSVSILDIRANGCIGDYQRDKKHHGGPNRAVCIFSQDVIEDLNSEGHPIKAGDCGENIVFSGLDWNSLRPGDQLELVIAFLKLNQMLLLAKPSSMLLLMVCFLQYLTKSIRIEQGGTVVSSKRA